LVGLVANRQDYHMSKYARRAAGERALLKSVFDDERREKAGGYYGVEFGRPRIKDDGGIHAGNRGAINPLHAVDRMHGRSGVPGYSRTGDADFGVPDSYHGGRHLDSGITRPAYNPEQTSYRSPVAGAGRSGGKPAWASVGRVRNNASDEYWHDGAGNANYYYPARRGPF
jgi:hypothetical protein